MVPNEDELESLWDMQQAILQIQMFTAEMSEMEYLDSELVQSAVERKLEILGEAARRVAGDFQIAHPEIDWRNIIRLRNVIAHRYDQVKQEQIWKIVQTLLPELLNRLLPLFPSLEESEE